jgi:hypothetical protein
MSETKDVMLNHNKLFYKKGENPLFDDGVYTIVENPNEDDAAIRINIDKYKGIVYQYGRVSFVEGERELQFERTIRHPADHDIEELYKNMELQALMGDILVEIILNQVKNEQQNQTNEGDK